MVDDCHIDNATEYYRKVQLYFVDYVMRDPRFVDLRNSWSIDNINVFMGRFFIQDKGNDLDDLDNKVQKFLEECAKRHSPELFAPPTPDLETRMFEMVHKNAEFRSYVAHTSVNNILIMCGMLTQRFPIGHNITDEEMIVFLRDQYAESGCF